MNVKESLEPLRISIRSAAENLNKNFEWFEQWWTTNAKTHVTASFPDYGLEVAMRKHRSGWKIEYRTIGELEWKDLVSQSPSVKVKLQIIEMLPLLIPKIQEELSLMTVQINNAIIKFSNFMKTLEDDNATT